MLTLRAKLLATAVLSSALTIAVTHPPRPNYNETDCWDDASCAATHAGYIVSDPNGTSDTRPSTVTIRVAAPAEEDTAYCLDTEEISYTSNPDGTGTIECSTERLPISTQPE